MLDFTPAYDDILDKLRTDLGAVRVYETNVPLDVEKNTVAGHFSPYVVMSFGGGIRAARGRSIVSTRFDVMQYWVVCTVVAPVDRQAREIKSEILGILTGFVPRDAGEQDSNHLPTPCHVSVLPEYGNVIK